MDRGRARVATADRAYAAPWYAVFPILLPLAVIIVGMAGLIVVVQSSGITATSYQLMQLQQVRSDWQQDNYQVKVEGESLQALSRIQSEAVGRLKMVPADRPLFVSLKSSPTEPLRPVSPRLQAVAPPPSTPAVSWWQRVGDWLKAWS